MTRPAFVSLILPWTLSLACGGPVDLPMQSESGEDSSSSAEGSTSAPEASTSGEPTTTDAPPATSTTSDETTGTPGTDSGTMAVCGDGEVSGDEVCDGAELGGQTCMDIDDAFVGGELACAANCAGYDTSACEVDPDAPLVAMNEVLSKSATMGPYADMGDAVELVNVGGAEADLSGWKISDDPTFPLDKTYVFPVGTVLMPGEWLVLVELDAMMGVGELPFGVSSDTEETLTLADGLDEVVDQVVVQGADAVVSYCRLPDGTGAWQKCDQTLGGANAAASSDCGNQVAEPGEDCDGADLDMQTCEGLGLGFTGGTLACTAGCMFDASMCETDSTVALNEIESTNDNIEIHNAGNSPVDISGWILTDDVVDMNYDPMLDVEKLVFPAMTSLAAKQFLVVAKGMGPGQHPFGLSANGDTVTLLQPNLVVVDQVSYGINEAVVSYCRLPDGPGGMWTTGCMATFGMANKGP